MENIDIRILISDNKVHYKEIAKVMNVCPEHLSRLMAEPLSLKNKLMIIEAIEELKKGAEIR